MGLSRLPRGLLRAQNLRKPMSECYACSTSSYGYTAPLRFQKPLKIIAGPCTGPNEALECTYWLFKSGQTRVWAIYPGQVMPGPGRLPRGILRAQNRRSFACSAFRHGYTAPLRVQKSSKNLAGPHGMPCDFPRVPAVLTL